MKNKVKNPIFRAMFIAAMSLLLNITANAQNIKQQTANPMDTTCALKGKAETVNGDTFYVILQIARSTNDTFKGVINEINLDTIYGKDSVIYSHLFNWVDLFPGQLDYVSRFVLISKKGNIFYSAKEYWSLKGILKKYDLTYINSAWTNDGCIVTLDIDNGRATEKCSTYFDYKIGSNSWKPINSVTKVTTGVTKNTSISITGLGQGTTVQFRARGKNNVGADTVTWNGTTNQTASLPITDLDTAMYMDLLKGYLSYRVYGSNLSTDVWVIILNTATGKRDSFFLKQQTSPYQERYNYLFSISGYGVKYEVTIYAKNLKGVGKSVTRSFITPAKPVETTIRSKSPIIDSVNLTMKAVFSYTLPQNNKFTQVDLKIWDNAACNGAPIMSRNVASNLIQSGEYTCEPIGLAEGTYWGRFSTDDILGIWPVSDTFKIVMVKKVWQAGVKTAALPTGPVQCKLYDMSGKLVSESWIVDPKVNLFTQELPIGVLIAVTDGFLPFKIYNQGK